MMNIKKRNVLLAAQHLFIEKGFRSTSVQDIIDEAKISKGTFYNYFSSKNECIIAILENAREETITRRRELHLNENSSDINTLVEQLTVRMNVYNEHKLFPLFISIIHSQDAELRDLIKKNYFDEINWLSKRLVDIFGEQTKHVSTDCSVLIIGMMQQLQHPWINQFKNLSFEQLVQFILRRVESIIYEMARSNDYLLHKSQFEEKKEIAPITKQQIIEQMEKFYIEEKKYFQEKEIQTIEFILEELSRENPRLFILEKVSMTFNELFAGKPIEEKAFEVINNVWTILQK